MTGLTPIQNILDLPLELQDKILDNVKNMTDFTAVINTCPLWDDLMDYRKVERLFPKVLYIMVNADPTFPLENVLKLRQISKKWKADVDYQLSFHVDRFFQLGRRFFRAEELEDFVRRAEELPAGANPILGNTLNCYINEEGAYPPLIQLIRQHGHHLKCVGLIFHAPRTAQNEPMLTHMPNLETLTLGGVSANWDTLPLPPLPYLKTLWLGMAELMGLGIAVDRNHQPLAPQIDTYITAYGHQLTEINGVLSLLRVEGLENRLPNLTELRISLVGDQTLTETDLKLLSKTGWHLEVLEIGGGHCGVHTTKAFFDMLNNFSGTLETLELNLRVETFDPSTLRVFPLLEQVRLYIRSTLQSIPIEMMDGLGHLVTVAPNLGSLEIYPIGKNAFADLQLNPSMMKAFFRKLNDFNFRPRVYFSG